MKNKIINLIVILLVVFQMSCSKWDDFKQYTRDGETVYPGKLDSIKIFSGYLRVRIVGDLPADPKISKVKITWKELGEKDSVIFTVQKSGKPVVFDTIFDINVEGTKNFKVQTFDDKGNGSVITNVTGKVYGPEFENSLLNRSIIKSVLLSNNDLLLSWNQIDTTTGAKGTVLSYMNTSGQEDTVIFSMDQKEISVENYKPGSVFTYRTLYIPDSTVIDSFYSAVDSASIFERKLDKTKFRSNPLPGDAPQNSNTKMEYAWDGTSDLLWPNVCFTPKSANALGPNMMTFNLGVKAKISKIIIYPWHEGNRYYYFTTMKRFEIWGSADPSSEGALDSSWYLLGSYTVEKPSGLPYGEENEIDKRTAKAGFNWEVNKDAPEVQYIRIKCLENFKGGYQLSISELTVFEDTRNN